MAVGSLTKNTKVNVSGFQVDENVIYYGNSAINTNNISLITISPIPANSSWVAAVVVALMGLLIRRESSIGWLLLIGAIVWIIAVVIHNKNRGEFLAISLNSGNTLYFHCKEREFLYRVISLMVECIKSGSGHYSISFDKCVINNDRGRTGNIHIG
ncbi:MAG: hypothetical protein J1F11_05320 [Oscillospiraceae bacterium]|nr:hypothetical protein [Oscillospiraceae bacterium]